MLSFILGENIFFDARIVTPQTQDINWTYIGRSEDILDVFWTSYVRSIYVLCLRGGFNDNGASWFEHLNEDWS